MRTFEKGGVALTSQPAADRVLDCRGTLCPMPVIRLRQAIDALEPGAVIQLIATDPASVNDMPAFARNTGHELLSSSARDGEYEFYFRKRSEA
jgi:tRNA 2-thiouridine synthesizing protein A